MNTRAFISLRKSQSSGRIYFRFYADGQAYTCHTQKSADSVLAAVGKLDKDTLVQVVRNRKDGSEWTDLQVKVPLEVTFTVDGEGEGGVKFATITAAEKSRLMDVAVDLDGVETRTFKRTAAPAAAATEDCPL